MGDYIAKTWLCKYKKPFRHSALLFIVGMENTVKTIGMVLIKGVNDKQYAEFIKNQRPVVKSNLNLQLP